MRSVVGGLFGIVTQRCIQRAPERLATTRKVFSNTAAKLVKNGRIHETTFAAACQTDTGANAESDAGQVGPFDRGAEDVHGFYSTKVDPNGKVAGHFRGMLCFLFQIYASSM